MEQTTKFHTELLREIEALKEQLSEANDTIEAIRNGQVDAFVVNDGDSQEVYTLKSADKTYRVFIERMTEGAVTVNLKGIILYSNSQFASMVGCNLSSVIGSSFQTFIADDHIHAFNQRLKDFEGEDGKIELFLHIFPDQV